MSIQLVPLRHVPIVEPGDDVPALILEALKSENLTLEDKDILIVAHTILSRAQGKIYELSTIKPGERAKEIANLTNKPPELVQLILDEAEDVLIVKNGHLITRTRHGLVCANSAVDRSNSLGEGYALTLPDDPDNDAKRISEYIRKETGKKVAVIISDTMGRVLREGVINIAVGVHGIPPLLKIEKKDLFGYQLQHTTVCIADELASAAELLMGQANEKIPVVVVKGFHEYEWDEHSSARIINRPYENMLFKPDK